MIWTQFGKSIKLLPSDHGNEYMNQHFFKFVTEHSTVHELTCVVTPQQNGVVKRRKKIKNIFYMRSLGLYCSKRLFLARTEEKLF